MQSLGPPAYRPGRVATLQQWYQWLDERGGMAGHPAVAAQAALIAADTGRPAEAERWADMADRWQYQDAARADDPVAEAWAAVARAVLCRRGVKQMSADADEAVQKLAAANIVAPVAALYQGIARILSGDPDDGDAYLKDTVSVAEQVGAHEILALALGERSLLAMARDDWSQAEALAGQAGAALRRIGMEILFACAVQARAAMHWGDVPAVRQQLVSAQRLRSVLTYATPHLAVQARIELTRVHLALADLAGARTLMREIDELLKRRADLGTLVDEARRFGLSCRPTTPPASPGRRR